MAATITQIAREAGVSISLVSRLLRGDPNAKVSDRRRQEILRIKDRLGGIAPRKTARSKVRTNVVLIPVNRLFTTEWLQANVMGSQKMRSLESAMQSQGLRMYFAFHDEAEMTESLVHSIYHGDCDALLMLDQNIYEWLSEFLTTRYVPHVSIDYHAEQYRVNSVHSHEPDGFRQAVEHLRELGHRRIGFVGTPHHYRYPLAVAALVAAGMTIDEAHHCWIKPLTVTEAVTRVRDNTREAFADWLDRRPAATALICSNDLVAQGVLDAMRQRGLVPGKDLSVVGHGNHEQRGLEPVTDPIITTVDNPADLVAQRAAALLVNQIHHGQTQIVHERIPTNLIVRKTTGPAPSA